MEKSTLESFLRTHVEDLEILDFHLHAELVNGKVEFSVKPRPCVGLSLDFTVDGNTVETR